MANTTYIRGMVFGVFDGLHEGHKHFLRDAATRCQELTVVLTSEEAARTLKGRSPQHSFEKRFAFIHEFDPRLKIISDDPVPGSWKIFEIHVPDKVFLGYDQKALKQELERKGISYEVLPAFEPERFKSSILNQPFS